MCSYIVEKAALVGSAKGRKGWMRIDTANVYFDHPYYSTLDHVLAIDFTNEGEGGRDRVAVELSAEFGACAGRADSCGAGERRGGPWRAGGSDSSRMNELRGAPLEHDPEKWMPVFGKDHAQSKS